MKAGLWILIAASSSLTPLISAQDAVNPAKTVLQVQAPSASLPPEKAQEAQACPKFPDRDWPIRSTIQARVAFMLDAAHLKPGKEVSARVMYPIKYADCSLEENATLYGHITAAVFSKEMKSSELDLVFDRADCTGHQKEEVHLRLIALIAPLDHSDRLHSALPSEVSGGVMGLPSIDLDDENLTPDYFPRTVHPGLVNRMPKVILEPEGGPGCSARISGSDRPIQLAPGTALIMTLGKVTRSKQ